MLKRNEKVNSEVQTSLKTSLKSNNSEQEVPCGGGGCVDFGGCWHGQLQGEFRLLASGRGGGCQGKLEVGWNRQKWYPWVNKAWKPLNLSFAWSIYFLVQELFCSFLLVTTVTSTSWFSLIEEKVEKGEILFDWVGQSGESDRLEIRDRARSKIVTFHPRASNKVGLGVSRQTWY